jgi:hypothetical protein
VIDFETSRASDLQVGDHVWSGTAWRTVTQVDYREAHNQPGLTMVRPAYIVSFEGTTATRTLRPSVTVYRERSAGGLDG